MPKKKRLIKQELKTFIIKIEDLIMIYAISGASGFIGSALRRRLEENDYTVYPIMRDQMKSVSALSQWLDENKVDEVFHLAAYGNHFNQTDKKEMLRANVYLTLNLFKASGSRKVYNFSTSSVTLPTRTPYSISKMAGEWLAGLFPSVVNIRPYSVYGPGEAEHRFIPKVCWAHRTGERFTLDESATHDWIYISDFLNALLSGHTIIGTGVKRTNLEIVQYLETISQKKLNYTPGSMRPYDNADWVCPARVPTKVSIEEGLIRTWNYYNK